MGACQDDTLARTGFAGTYCSAHEQAATTIQHWFRHSVDSPWRYLTTSFGPKLRKWELAEWKSEIMRSLWLFFHTSSDSSVKSSSNKSRLSAELFVLMSVTSWILTWTFQPQIFNNNPLLKAWGYNNICVGFDVPPAQYFALVCWGFVTTVNFEAAGGAIFRVRMEMKMKRFKGHTKWLAVLICICHGLWALSSLTFLLCFAIPPTQSLHGHTRPFMIFGVAQYLSQAAGALEFFIDADPCWRASIPKFCLAFLLFRGILTVGLSTLAELTYAYHEEHPDSDPLVPWQLSCSMDYAWLLSLCLLGFFLPSAPLVVNGRILHRKTLVVLRTHFRKNSTRKKVACCSCSRESPCVNSIGDLVISSTDKMNTDPETKNAIRGVSFGFGAMASSPSASSLTCGLTVSVMHAKFIIDERIHDLAPWHRYGFFESVGEYDAIVRINVTEHGAVRLSIRVDVPDSMELCCESEGSSIRPGFRQVDLLLAEEFKHFFLPTVRTLHKMVDLKTNFGICKVLQRIGAIRSFMKGESYAKRALDNTKGIAGKNYYAGLPFALGPASAFKFGLQAKIPNKLSTDEMPCGKVGAPLTRKEAEATEKYAAAMVSLLDNSLSAQIEWDFVIQIAKYHASHTVFLRDQGWDELVSPYRAVGRLVLFPLQANAGVTGMDGPPLYFNPWNQLAAHQPLGPLNRARLEAYRSHQSVRKAAGGAKQVERVCPYLQHTWDLI